MVIHIVEARNQPSQRSFTMTKNTYRVTLPITFTFSEAEVQRIVGNYEKPTKSPVLKTNNLSRKKSTSLAEMEKSCIAEAFEAARGNKTVAARILGIDVRTLKTKLSKYRIFSDSTVKTTVRRRRKKRPSKHTLESCINVAKNFKSRSEWQRKERNSYSAARRNKWLDVCCKHMAPQVRGRPSLKQQQFSNFQGFKFEGALNQ